MKNLFKVQFSILLIFLVASCQEQNRKKSVELTDENSVLVEHPLGETRVPKNPDRVVVMEYGSLDTMKELGLDEKVVGIPKNNLPAYLNAYEEDETIKNTGGLMDLNFQTINELQPDLIIIGNRQVDDYEELSKIAPTIFMIVDYADYTDSFKENARYLGDIFGKEELLEKKLKNIDKVSKEIQEFTKKDDKEALIVMYNERKFSAYGKGSRFGIVHDVFGIEPASKNLEVAVHGKSISNEYIYDTNPDYLFIIDRGAAINTNKANRKEVENALIQKTNAFKEDKIVYLSPDIWYLSGGGLMSFQRMAEEIKSALY
ncbi:MAG: siderophore ABC transporter substrate-binding protein [Flavobacteriaceae bacterium]